MEDINIKDFLRYYLKFIPYVAILVVVVAIATFIYGTSFKTPMFTSKASIVLVKNENNANTQTIDDTIDTNDISLNQKLVATYRKIIKSRLVLEQVITKSALDYTYEELFNEVSVNAEEGTEILNILVTDKNAQKSAKIANNIVDVFGEEVIKMYNINNISFLDKAQVPTSPSNNTVVRDVLLAIIIITMSCSGLVFLIYYFDDTLRYSDDVDKQIDLPVIGKIFKDDNNIDLLVDKKPKAYTSENIRTLRTNLQFATVDDDIKTILITSTIPSEGKSFISTNLATAYAQAGKKVLLVDCDLRKGRQHKIFKISSRRGLSNILISSSVDLGDYLHKSKIENLYVLSRGVCPPNPSELLSSKKIKKLIDELKTQFDIIIFDGAPISGLSDSLIISSMADRTILVSSVNKITKSAVIDSKKSLESAGANIAGLVLNNISLSKSHHLNGYYYANYGYYNSYYGEDNK